MTLPIVCPLLCPSFHYDVRILHFVWINFSTVGLLQAGLAFFSSSRYPKWLCWISEKQFLIYEKVCWMSMILYNFSRYPRNQFQITNSDIRKQFLISKICRLIPYSVYPKNNHFVYSGQLLRVSQKTEQTLIALVIAQRGDTYRRADKVGMFQGCSERRLADNRRTNTNSGTYCDIDQRVLE